MSLSAMPTSFSESAEQSLSPELSDELTMALAAGRWWAIMEVAFPISEESDYENLTYGWGAVEAGELSSKSSMVFSKASDESQSLHAGFSDAKVKTTKQERSWRLKKPQGAQVAAESSQAALVSAGSHHGAPVHKYLQITPVPAPKVPSCSPEKVQDRQKIIIPEPLRQQQKPQTSIQEALLDNISKRRKLKIPEPLRMEEPRENPQASSLQEAFVSEETSKMQKLKILVPLKQEMVQQKPQSSKQEALPDKNLKRQKLKIPEPLRMEELRENPQASSFQEATVSEKTSKRQKLKTLVPQKQEMEQQKPQSSIHEALPDNISKRQKLKIPDPLRRDVLRQNPRASSLKGELVPDKNSKVQKFKIPVPLKQEMLQQKPDCCTQGALPDNISKRQKLKIPEPLRQELLQQKPQASFQGALPEISKRRKLKIPEYLRQELLQQKPQASFQGALLDTSKKQKLKIPEPLTLEVLQQNPQASSLQGILVPDKTSRRQKLKIPVPLKQEMLQQKPVCCTQGAPIPKKIPVNRKLKIPELLRKELLQQKPPKTSKKAVVPPGSPQGLSGFQQEAHMAASAPQGAPVPVNSPFQQETPQGPPAPNTIKRGKFWIPRHLLQQKPRTIVQSLPGPHMSSLSKRMCPWSTEASQDNVDVSQPPPQNKTCEKIDKKVQTRSRNQIRPSHLDQSSIQLRFHSNWKRELDNTGGDQSPPHKSSWQSKMSNWDLGAISKFAI